MNKQELIKSIAGKADLKKSVAEEALACTLNAIVESLAKDEGVTLVGFGSFSTARRNARKGRNPQNGKAIEIPSKKVAKFKAGKLLEQAIN